MNSLLTDYINEGDIEMQHIDNIVKELKTIMQDNGISQNQVVNALDSKCSRNTILNFFKADADCKLSTLLMILEACGADLRIETERSKEAIMSGDIASYRAEIEQLRSQLNAVTADKNFFVNRYTEISEKNTQLTSTLEKQQNIIDRYMVRMENSENALYQAMDSLKRKDARIVELQKECNKW